VSGGKLPSVDYPPTANGEEAPSPFYIQAPSALADEQTRVLKHGDAFAVFDHYGDVKPSGLGEEGLYYEGTRHLSVLLLLLDEQRPLFLSSTVKEDNGHLTVDLTNPDLLEGGRVAVPRGTVHLFRCKFLWGSSCYERIRLKNFGVSAVEVSFALHFRADFADIFEVRGTHRPRRGRSLGAAVDGPAVVIAYQGLDGVRRRTRLDFHPAPHNLRPTDATFRVALPPQGEAAFELVVSCEQGDRPAAQPSYESAQSRSAAELRAAHRDACAITTSNAQFNEWIIRAAADLDMMTTQTPAGPYPYAGVPWFSTPFGRDGIITALECLWFDPDMARGVLTFLAGTQASHIDPARDAEPGKILHEARGGEMAALGEVPFGRYYGSVDATPLFVMLAGEYFRRTGDRAFLESIWPNVGRALHWIDRYGDRDGDGFVEYLRNSPNGLGNQGWKDSHDSVFHADGMLAEGPIALCEVQGYVYAARLAAAELAEILGDRARADVLRKQAAVLKEQFGRAYWCEDLGTYALALDGAKRPCRVRTSNPGHCLWTGIAETTAGHCCGLMLFSDQYFSGWGIRTVASGEARYNPMSYHDGSVWPHDNALAAAGLAHYGLREEAVRVMNALFDVSKAVDLNRLPELFCGFLRRPGEGPTRYPVACAPQAWSAAAVFLLLQTCLGLEVRADPPQVRLTTPQLPDYLSEVRIDKLRVAGGAVDLLLRSRDDAVSVDVLRRDANVEVSVIGQEHS
jgi:glycogen debranching enzyme